MEVGLDRSEIGKFAVGKIDHVLLCVEIIDGLFAKVGWEQESIGGRFGIERVAGAADQPLRASFITGSEGHVAGTAIKHVTAFSGFERAAARAGEVSLG